MNQQTPDQGWQQLQESIDGFFEHVFRKETENALMSVSRREAKIEHFGTKPKSVRTKKSKRSSDELVSFPLTRTPVMPRSSTSP